MEEKEILDFINSFEPKRKIKPVNFFDIGFRGMFENPFTEILAYLLLQDSSFSQRNEFASLFLRKFLSDVPQEDIDDLSSNLFVETQVRTRNGNFMDMVLYNEKYVLVYENKINHWLANPLDDYVSEIEARFPNHIKLFFVFSLYDVTTPALWKNILIGDVYKHIKDKLTLE